MRARSQAQLIKLSIGQEEGRLALLCQLRPTSAPALLLRAAGARGKAAGPVAGVKPTLVGAAATCQPNCSMAYACNGLLAAYFAY